MAASRVIVGGVPSARRTLTDNLKKLLEQ